MNQPTKRIGETEALLVGHVKVPYTIEPYETLLLQQILRNQLTLLRAVRTQLIWDDKE